MLMSHCYKKSDNSTLKINHKIWINNKAYVDIEQINNQK